MGPLSKASGRRIRQSPSNLFSKPQLFYDILISLQIGLPEVIEKPPPLPHQLQEASPGVVVLLVRFEVIGQIGYPIAQNRDLNLRRAGVLIVQLETINNLLFGFYLCYATILRFRL